MTSPRHDRRHDRQLDRQLVATAEHLIYGGELARLRRQGLYAGYLVVLGSIAYGFPILQATLRTADPATLRAALMTPAAAAITALAALATGALMFAVGRTRGPIVPPLPYLDLVAASPLDRAAVLRRPWRRASWGTQFVGVMAGLVGAGALAYAGAASAWVLVPGALLGWATGWLVGRLWLLGQVASWPRDERHPHGSSLLLRSGDALRQLHTTSLAEHCSSSQNLGGALATGDLRTLRLNLATPIRHGRRARLRPAPAPLAIIQRDLLGLRRMPFAFALGVGLTAAGAVLQTWGWGSTAVPLLAVVAGSLVTYLGVSVLSEGARGQSDTSYAPPLLGVTGQVEALAHVVTPAIGGLAVSLAVAAGLHPPSATGYLWPIIAVPAAAGAALVAAFRGIPAEGPIASSLALGAALIRYAAPVLVQLVVVSYVARVLRQGDSSGWPTGVTAAAALIAWGVDRARKAAQPMI